MEACFDRGRIAVGHTIVISLQCCISAVSSVTIMFFKLDIILLIFLRRSHHLAEVVPGCYSCICCTIGAHEQNKVLTKNGHLMKAKQHSDGNQLSLLLW